MWTESCQVVGFAIPKGDLKVLASNIVDAQVRKHYIAAAIGMAEAGARGLIFGLLTDRNMTDRYSHIVSIAISPELNKPMDIGKLEKLWDTRRVKKWLQRHGLANPKLIQTVIWTPWLPEPKYRLALVGSLQV